MSQIDQKTQRFVVSNKITGNSAIDQHLRGEGGSRWSPTSPENSPEQKKSVLTKVKENAMKLKHTLSNKKKLGEVEDGNSTPPRSSLMEDDNEEDAEFLGAPMYESEKSPEGYKENLRQHPRADPVISRSHLLPAFAGKTGAETGYEMAASLKKLSLVEAKPCPPFESSSAYCSSPRKTFTGPIAVDSNKKMTRSMTEKLAPTYLNSSKSDHPVLTPCGRLSRETPFSTAEAFAAGTARMAVGGSEKEQSPIKGISVEEKHVRILQPN